MDEVVAKAEEARVLFVSFEGHEWKTFLFEATEAVKFISDKHVVVAFDA